MKVYAANCDLMSRRKIHVHGANWWINIEALQWYILNVMMRMTLLVQLTRGSYHPVYDTL